MQLNGKAKSDASRNRLNHGVHGEHGEEERGIINAARSGRLL
jgi:hypothetical protein